ncbi:hypothetical protein LPB41_23190 [Thalassospira sp. MA62]|nr:hypothetical protein [Thalassospira sp. MA62]
MSETYHARPLTSQTADMTFPLVQMLQADLTLDRWREFVAEFCLAKPTVELGAGCDDVLWLRPRGIIVISNERGYIHGFFSYHVRDDMADGRVLHVDNVMAVEIVSRDHVLNTMRGAMSKLATMHGCKNVHVTLGEMERRLREYFGEMGFAPSKVRYCAPASPAMPV